MIKKEMILKSLLIRKSYSYDAKTNAVYTGEVEFTSQHGEIKLNLTPEQVEGVLAVCAESVVAASKDVAESLTSAALSSHTALIEQKDE